MVKYRLGDICEIVSGSTPKTGVSEYWDGDKKWITPAEITDESYIITDSVRKLTELGVTNTGLSSFPKGTVILSSRAPIGKVAIAGCEMYCNQGFKNLICSQKIYNRYLYWFLKGNTEYLNSLGRGATFKEISKQIVASIEINVPDMGQQMQAAENLERVSSIVRLRKQELQKLDDLVKARFVELFGEPRSNPFGYPKTMLKNSCKVVTGNTPSRTVAEYYGDYVEWIKTDNIVPGVLNPTEAAEYLSEKGMMAGRTVDKGSVLMACIAGSVASIGRVCITDRKVAFNQQINAIIPEKYNTLFLYVLLQMSKDYLIEDINMSLKGILSKSKLEGKEFIIPPVELQNQFAAFVTQTDKSKAVIQKALDETRLLFDSLMQEYFG